MAREGNEAKAKKADLENVILEAKVKEATGHLINRAEVVMAVSSAFLRLGKSHDSFAATMGREYTLPPDTVRGMRARLDEMRKNFVRDTAEYIDVVESPDGKTASKRA